jgi:hypothetical protein
VISLPSLDENGIGLTIEFEWREDRFVHSVSVVKGDSRHVAWESQDVEDHGPVFQQIHEQEDDTGRSMVLLMGASHCTNWSMSVQATEPGTLCFDVASRTSNESSEKSAETQQASHYFRASKAEEFLMKCAVIALSDSKETHVFQDSVRTSIWSESESVLEQPATIRWKYLMTQCKKK